MIISGTREWSSHSANCLTGCLHDCRYCYAREQAIRFRRVPRREDWPHPVILENQLRRRWRKVEGTIMFPSTHDIFPEFLQPCLSYLLNILSAGNRVLIVSKPHLCVIKDVCLACERFRPDILFRFTIGAMDDSLLAYWEPGAPRFDERLASLQFARASGYATSVSIEPMLDSSSVEKLVSALAPHVTDSIWIGKMNDLARRVQVQTEEDRIQLRRIAEGQTDQRIREIYAALKDQPLIRWKESCKKVLGLPLAGEAGLDK